MFFDKDIAKKVASKCGATSTEIEPNKAFPLKYDEDFPECDSNNFYLGGYSE